MPEALFVMSLVAATAAAVAGLGLLYRKIVRPIVTTAILTVKAVEKVEQQTRQLTTNGGTHLRDDVIAINAKVDAVLAEQADVKSALMAKDDALARRLDDHVLQDEQQHLELWKALATYGLTRPSTTDEVNK